MDAIGGYLELELCKGAHFHKDALRLNTARNCFEYVLRARHYTKVYLPYYTCDALLEPLQKIGVQYEFYHINESLEPVSLPSLQQNEAFLYTNYFGLKYDCAKRLAEVYKNQFIIDNAQAFYALPIEGIDTFYSARKFFGVPDGAYLYTDCRLAADYSIDRDFSYARMSHLLKRIDLCAEEGYSDFRAHEAELCNQNIQWMSKLTEQIMKGIDYESVSRKRRENYQKLDAFLAKSNQFKLSLPNDAVPMVYPYMTDNKSLKQKLIDNKIFVPTYWSNVLEWCNPGDWEADFAQQCLFLPVDQRYDGDVLCKRIKEIILR